MKKRQSAFILIAMAALMSVFFLTGCTTGGLSGAWKMDYGIDPQNVFEFKGNQFTFTQYDGVPTERGGVSILNGSLCTEDESNNRQELKTADGHAYYRVVSTGTFSISDEKIEFTLSNGSVTALPFSRADNKINIDRMPFVRR